MGFVVCLDPQGSIAEARRDDRFVGEAHVAPRAMSLPPTKKMVARAT